MPTWGQILQEIAAEQAKGTSGFFDRVRRKHLAQLHAHTGRNTVLYASRWTQGNVSDPWAVSITDEDVQAFMEVFHGLSNESLDIVLHSPGGSAEATEAIVSYIRTKFDDVRVIVPHQAMSAATMMACSANRIVMGKHSFLGPIDPQVLVRLGQVSEFVPAQALLEQFELAKAECKKDKASLAAWMPMLPQYGPARLVQCKNVSDLAQSLVATWLKTFMFRGSLDAGRKAGLIARKLNHHTSHKTHSRHIPRKAAEDLGLVIERLEDDQILQDRVLSVFHATTHTFTGTQAVKIVENHAGKAFVKQVMARPRPPGARHAPPPSQ